MEKARHPGVPADWALLGEGGSAYVWFDGTHAIKRLKPTASAEAVARFRREAEISRTLQASGGPLQIVPLHEVRERADALEIAMEKLDGNLDAVIHRFSGQPEKAARALVPITETLAALSRRVRKIFHRDIKPTNLLYRENEDNLYLSDFGCAYLAEDERLTPQKRAMGAWAYRPPEYSVGRVAELDEKGDVFSLGKVFWAMINGELGVVFPGPVWFTDEYDLGRIFPDRPGIHHAMVLISKAAAVKPDARPSLQSLADMFRALAAASTTAEGEGAAAELLRAEALIEGEHAQRVASSTAFIRAIYSDLIKAIEDLRGVNPDLRMWQEWEVEARRSPQKADALVQQVAVHESDAPVVIVRFRRYMFVTRFYPPVAGKPTWFFARFTSEDDTSKHTEMIVENDRTGIKFRVETAEGVIGSGDYTSSTMRGFLEEATRRVMMR